MLSRDELLKARDRLPYEEVDVPELGGSVGVLGMTAGDAIDFFNGIKKDDDTRIAMAKMVCRCLVDDGRRRVYTNDEWELLLEWPHMALQRVFNVAARLNRGSSEGNLGETPGDGSSSA